MATREEERVDRNEESQVERFVADAFPAFQTFSARFSSDRQTTMIRGSSDILRVLGGPSLRSG